MSTDAANGAHILQPNNLGNLVDLQGMTDMDHHLPEPRGTSAEGSREGGSSRGRGRVRMNIHHLHYLEVVDDEDNSCGSSRNDDDHLHHYGDNSNSSNDSLRSRASRALSRLRVPSIG